MKLRGEVLRFPRTDGGLDLYDPLLERVTALSREEAEALVEGAVPERLAAALLVEGPAAEQLRERAWAARTSTFPATPSAAAVTMPERARDLPDIVAAAWRDDEAWRRLAEERAAGRERLVVRGFLAEDFAARLAADLETVTWTRMETELVRAWRWALPGGGDAITAMVELLAGEPMRATVGGALGVELPARIVGNAWRMGPGDGMRAHPDGRRYAATWAIGLCAAWTAADGGAIAFGDPRPGGFEVRERWLPFRGDLCLFVPRADAWHVVEAPRRERVTVSGWWGS